jgi:hypothetical protein
LRRGSARGSYPMVSNCLAGGFCDPSGGSQNFARGDALARKPYGADRSGALGYKHFIDNVDRVYWGEKLVIGSGVFAPDR